MDQGRREEIAKLRSLCLRHRLSLRWASLMDGGPSEFDVPFVNSRLEVLERALSCERCLARNGLSAAAALGATTSSPAPVWNPSTAEIGSHIPTGLPPAGYGFADRRERQGPKVHIGLVLVGTAALAIAVGLLALLAFTQMSFMGGSDSQVADQTAHVTGGRTDDPPLGEFEERPAGEAEEANGLVEYADLRVGDCVRDTFSEAADLGLDVVDCEVPHTDEVFWTFSLPKGTWPGQKVVERLGWRGCDARLERYIGVPPDDTDLEIYMTPPVKIGWPADRVVVCSVAEQYEQQGTGSLRDANH